MDEEKLESRNDFPFPFTPYSIQQDFMSNLYRTLEEGKLGIFESPTGTGKSLSVICGALSWLLDHEDRERRQLRCAITNLAEEAIKVNNDDWFNQQSKQAVINQKKILLERKLKVLEERDEKFAKLRSKKKVTEKPDFTFGAGKVPKSDENKDSEKNDIPDGGDKCNDIFDDQDIMLEDIISDEEGEDEDCLEEEEEEYQDTKIFFCSRTHSQLAQFVGEVQRSSFGRSIRLVSLASRQNYCINEVVNKLKSMSLINERCLDLQKRKKGATTAKSADGSGPRKKSKCSSGCPHLRQKAVEELRDECLVEVRDVEQLVAQGTKMAACPYYAARAAVRGAQVVVVPYNTLLHRSTRESSGISLRGAVVVVDEAHNLLDALAHMHSAELSGHQIVHAIAQLNAYRQRYDKRFSPVNRLYLDHMIYVSSRLLLMLGGEAGCFPQDKSSKCMDTKLHSLSDFVISAEIDHFNMYKLIAFCKKNKITQKLQGFAERYQPTVHIQPKTTVMKTGGLRAFLKEIVEPNNEAAEAVPAAVNAPMEEGQLMSNNPLQAVVGFMECLTNRSHDGRVMCTRVETVGRGKLKYLLLNPAAHFADVVKEARSVVVAGGTMQPISEFTEQLFAGAGAASDRIVTFSCGHVVPADAILPIVVTHGPSGRPLDFSYQQRNALGTMNELGRLLSNVCNVVPAGVVCFFPSYEYETRVFDHLTHAGIIAQIAIKKKIFREPKKSGSVDQVLTGYADSINNLDPNSKVNGALLFSVIGGKLSEGLNFSDNLGRCVIVVGMPYPNIKSAELQEKMNYLNATLNSSAGKTHYENLCMKAVNQSIGRAVRHRGDFAAVLLLDQRFARPHTQELLPEWIRESLRILDKFGPLLRQLSSFFSQQNSNGKLKNSD